MDKFVKPSPEPVNPSASSVLSPSVPVAFGALVLGGVAMGLSPVFVREAEVGAFASAFWRVLFALPALLLWFWFEAGRTFRFSQPALPLSVIFAGLFFAGDLVLWHLAILNTTMANATFLLGFAPFWVMVFSRLTIGEMARGNEYAGLALCLAGMGLLIGSSLSFHPERLLGDIYGVITSFFLGFYFLAMRSARKELPSGQLFFVSTSITALALLVVALISGDTMWPETWSGIGSLVTLGVFTHAGGQGLVTVALGVLTAMFSSLVIFIEAIAAAFFGWLLYNESLGLLQWAGGVLVMLGIWLARPHKMPVEPPRQN